MYIIFSIPGGNNTEVDMVDSTQMEKFEFDKSNQTYLGKNSKNNNSENGVIFLFSDLPLGGPPFGIQKWEVPEDGLFT